MTEIINRDVVRAIIKGNTSKLKAYFTNGFSPASVTDKERWNLLHQAMILVGRPVSIDSAELLISMGVQVDAQDIYGNTPLHYCSRNKDVEAIKCLLKAGAEVNLMNNEGITPLHQTLINNPINLQATEVLLASGASLNIGTVKDFVSVLDVKAINELFNKYD